MKLFIDLETTGLPKTKGFCNWYNYTELDKYESSRIIELGIIVTEDNGNIISEYTSLVKPDNFTSLKPIITKITPRIIFPIPEAPPVISMVLFLS